jgi:hypothetical protein
MRWARRRTFSEPRDIKDQTLLGEATRPKPSEAERRLLLVLSTAVKHLDVLSALVARSMPPSCFFDGQPDRELLPLAPRLLSETALLVLAASRVLKCDSSRPAEIQALFEWLVWESAKIPLVNKVIRAPAQFALPAGSIVLAREAAGRNSGRLGIVVREIVLGRDLDRFDSTIAQATGIRWLRIQLGCSSRYARWNSAFDASFQTSAPDALWVGRADLYDLAHTVFHMTDWGFRAPPTWLDTGRLAQVARAGIAGQIVDCDLDLLAELLLASAGPRIRWTSACMLGWSVLVAVWDAIGYLPRPGYLPAVASELGRHEARCYWLRHHYHALWAAGLLCAALAARPQRANSLHVATHIDEQGRRIFDRVHHPGWMDSVTSSARRRAFEVAPIGEADKAAIVFEGCLIRAVRVCDLNEIRRLVRAGDAYSRCSRQTLDDAKAFVQRWQSLTR